jgi:hypothetical protein
LPKARVLVDRDAPDATPVPVRLTRLGELAALLKTLTEPLWAPNDVGLKVTTMLQEADMAKVEPQVVVLLY